MATLHTLSVRVHRTGATPRPTRSRIAVPAVLAGDIAGFKLSRDLSRQEHDCRQGCSESEQLHLAGLWMRVRRLGCVVLVVGEVCGFA